MKQELSPELKARLKSDRFAALIGASLLEASPGYALMELRLGEMHTGVPGVTHGGCVFALAEAALAAATHARNIIHLAVSVNIVFHAATKPGDRLVAEAREVRSGGRTAYYTIEIRDGEEKPVASLHAVVYRTSTPLMPTK